MGFFSRNNNNGLLKVIDWTDNTKNTIVYKFPMDGRKITYGSKLTVRESQVAIFMHKGEIADIFGPGMHKLETANLPILTKLMSWPYGFNSPFFADVFFVSTKQFVNQKWGTTNPFLLKDKDFGPLRVRGYGTYAFKVDNPETLLTQLFGTNSSFTTEDINDYIKSLLISSISDAISESKISAVELATNLNEFNETAADACGAHLKEIGLKLTNLVIENLSFPEEVEKAIDTRSSLGVLGDKMDTYVKYQSAQAMRDAAQNEGSGVANVGVGLGTGLAIGDMMRESLKKQSQDSEEVKEEKTAKKSSPKKFCPNCGAEMKLSAKFCPECGTKQEVNSVCANCGAPLSKNAKFCPECGHKR